MASQTSEMILEIAGTDTRKCASIENEPHLLNNRNIRQASLLLV